MKKLILSLIACLALGISLNARTFVLVTGVSRYANENSNLEQTTKDAKRFKQLMETQTKDITLLTSKYVTSANVLEKLRAIANRAQSGDRIVFFYSGHGMEGAMYGYDGPIWYEDIIDVLNTSAASEKICFIDACHAGTMTKVDDTKGSSAWKSKVKPGQAFFVACRPDEYSYENPFVGAGFFTQALLKGLQGKSDKNSDKKITIKELFDYIYGDVVKRSKNEQHPQLQAPQSMYNVSIFNCQLLK